MAHGISAAVGKLGALSADIILALVRRLTALLWDELWTAGQGGMPAGQNVAGLQEACRSGGCMEASMWPGMDA